ncbi:MAG TPA: HPF/RaiA family ribosome-associated protein [Thiobacillaceae bacterium]|nr:HPF/RaiA family ribosome-associated protein [Thiobacillaceae bacterium]
MKLPLQIIQRDMPPSEALEAAIREKADKLDHFYPHIMSCRVTVEIPGKHRNQGKEFKVRIDLTVPGTEIVVDRDHHEDVYVALRDAFDHAKRQLEDYARRQRGDVKAHEAESRGRVARLFPAEGYGFIRAPDERELYFSADNVVHPSFDRLAEGMDVTYLEEAGGEGPQAKRVSAT